MAETLYTLFDSQAFWVVMIVWAFICIAWVERFKPLLQRLGQLVSKPIIFKADPKPDNVAFYPRGILEDSANGLRDTLRQPFTDLIKTVSKWFGKLSSLIYDKKHPFRTLGYIIILASFLFFVLADSIAVANTLVVLELWSGKLPEILGRFDIAVFGGSLLALIIGLALVFEIRANESEFTLWSTRDRQTKSLALTIAFLVTLLSFLTLIAWALFRLIELDRLTSNALLDGILNWILFGLVPINSALAAAITFLDGLRGLLALGIVSGWLIVGVLYLVDYLATIIGSLVPFLFDLLYRLIYIVVDIAQWFITTPIHAFLWPFRAMGKVLDSNKKDNLSEESSISKEDNTR